MVEKRMQKNEKSTFNRLQLEWPLIQMSYRNLAA